MSNLKKSSIILLSIGFISVSQVDSKSKLPEPFEIGYYMGGLDSICGFYKSDQISESIAKKGFKEIFEIINNSDFSVNNKKLFFEYADHTNTKECKKLMPN